jgi:hypothetical protein
VTFLLVVAYGVVQIGKLNDFPHASTWASRSPGWWAYVILAILATASSALVILGYRALLATRGENEAFAKLARGVVRVVEKNTTLRHHELGVNIWVLQGPPGFRRLERRAMSLAEERPQTPILWTKGKGAIGRCWARNESTFADLEGLRGQFRTPGAWCAQPRDERFRFSWAEFQDTRRYTAILAVPLLPRIYGRYRFRGVLAIDTTAREKGTELAAVSEESEFGVIIRTCQAVLAKGAED